MENGTMTGLTQLDESHYIFPFIRSLNDSFPENQWTLEEEGNFHNTFLIGNITKSEALEVVKIFSRTHFANTSSVKFILNFSSGLISLTYMEQPV